MPASHERFYTEIANAASRLGYFALYELWCGDKPVAFDLGFSLQGRYFVPKVAYNEAFKAGQGRAISSSARSCAISRSAR